MNDSDTLAALRAELAAGRARLKARSQEEKEREQELLQVDWPPPVHAIEVTEDGAGLHFRAVSARRERYIARLNVTTLSARCRWSLPRRSHVRSRRSSGTRRARSSARAGPSSSDDLEPPGLAGRLLLHVAAFAAGFAAAWLWVT